MDSTSEYGLGWCVVLLMRYLGIVWGTGYPREQVGAVPPLRFFRGATGLVLPVTRAIAFGHLANCTGQLSPALVLEAPIRF
jgi:hypothetical protein